MSKQWPMVRLGEVLIEQKQRIGTFDADNLPLLGVSNQDGLHRSGMPRIPEMSRYLRVEKNWFAYNPMRINVGSVGWAEKPEQTGVISPDYVVFSCSERILPRLLFSFLKHRRGLQEINDATAGSVRERLYFHKLAQIEFPLPPLAEQRRVVAQIEELAAQIHEARTLRHQAAEEAEVLLRSILTHDEQAKPTHMRELVKLRPPDVTVRADETYQFAGVYCFGRGVFKSVRKSGMDFAYPRLTRLRAGEFVYPKLMAWEGALGVVPPECDGCVVSTEFPVFEVNEKRVLPEVLDTYFRTPTVWLEIAGESTGTNVRRRRLNPKDFLDYEMPLPSMKTQMTLRKVRAEVDAVKRLQAATVAELDALLPALLDRAFKGEL